MKLLPCLALVLMYLGCARAASPHEHGVAHLDVAVDGQRLTISLETPLENLLGFERAPRTETERKSVALLQERLKAPTKLLLIDPAAGCSKGQVELFSAALGWGQAKTTGEKGNAHADLDASFSFECTNANKASFIDIALFEAFPKLTRLNVQLASAKGQSKTVLKRPAKRLTLPS